jgi:hypothetical protein
MALGYDYAFLPHPSISALKGAGATFVCRYISSYAPNDTNGKNLIPSEASALLSAGMQIALVAEEGANRMLSGNAAGIADAQHADAVVKGLGMPGLPIYFACDFDASLSDQTLINAYLDGAASVIGRGRVGIYGGYYPVSRALTAGKAIYAWQTYAWSGGLWDTRAQLRQVANGLTLNGASVDRDTSMVADFGQWPSPGGTPIPDPNVPVPDEEDDMYELKDNVAVAYIKFLSGKYQWVAMDADTGLHGLKSQQLRLAFKTGPKAWTVTTVLVPDSNGGTITVDLPPTCNGISVLRTDLAANWAPVGFNLG